MSAASAETPQALHGVVGIAVVLDSGVHVAVPTRVLFRRRNADPASRSIANDSMRGTVIVSAGGSIPKICPVVLNNSSAERPPVRRNR
jgi:hypothetical protein